MSSIWRRTKYLEQNSRKSFLKSGVISSIFVSRNYEAISDDIFCAQDCIAGSSKNFTLRDSNRPIFPSRDFFTSQTSSYLFNGEYIKDSFYSKINPDSLKTCTRNDGTSPTEPPSITIEQTDGILIEAIPMAISAVGRSSPGLADS
jgi:hypothetical protein